jgi:hypothetical protein
MRLQLDDTFKKRAWVAMAYDARSRKACWEWVEREDFDDPTFYLSGPGIYCVSGDDPAKDRCRWLEIKDGRGQWRNYDDIAHFLPERKGKYARRIEQNQPQAAV